MANFNNVDTFAELQQALIDSKNNGEADTVNITGDITLTDLLPLIEEDTALTINGGSSNFTISGNDTHRLFFVKSGAVNFSNLNFADGLAQGGRGNSGGAGMGGALFVYDGAVSITNSAFVNNQAIGGAGGFGINGFGGGGFGGDGANSAYDGGYSGGGGGGGGFNYDGNRGAGNTGGLGGGFFDSSASVSDRFGQGGDGAAASSDRGGSGGFGGGGGGGGLYGADAGSGGFGGGGGGGAANAGSGGNGGYGGGGGGYGYGNFGYSPTGTPGFGGGNGGGFSGGGGAGMGGGIFIRSGSLTISNSRFANNVAVGGSSSAGNGQGLGGAIFAMKSVDNANGNNQGMPTVLPSVALTDVIFLDNEASDNSDTSDLSEVISSGEDLDTEDLFGADISRTFLSVLTPLAGLDAVEITRLNPDDDAIQLRIQSSELSSVSELRIFSTDASSGNRQQLGVFSLLGNDKTPGSFNPVFALKDMQIAEGKSLQFEIIENGVARIASPTRLNRGQIQLDFGEGTLLDLQMANKSSPDNLLVSDADAIDLSSQSGSVNMEFTVYREAGYDNIIGFYTTDAADGSIVTDPLTGNTLRPGEAGYKAAALERQLDIRLSTENGLVSTFSAEIAGGGFISTFLIADGSDPSTDRVYFAHADANAGSSDHVKLLGNNAFGFEDMAGLGDRDYNDMVVKFEVL